MRTLSFDLRVVPAALWVPMVLLACDAADLSDASPDAASFADSSVVAPSLGASSPMVAMASFVGTWDPVASEMRFVDHATGFVGEGGEGMAQPLYCDGVPSSGTSPAFAVATVPGSIGVTPSACGVPDAFPYTAAGVFCVTVSVTSLVAERVDAAYVELTSMTPSTGYRAYPLPYGTGVDPSRLPIGFNQPSDAAGGLWAYGPLEAGETVSKRWVLQYQPGPFQFEGRVLAAVPERINGVDDNCDGAIDEAPFAAGEACAVDTDCFHDRCDGGVCVERSIVTPEGFVRIEAGSFTMGSPPTELGRSPTIETAHPVTLTNDFFLQATPVTQAQWEALMGTTPFGLEDCPECPVTFVNGFEAAAYVNALSEAEDLPPCYRLVGCNSDLPGNDMQCSSLRLNDGYDTPYECEGYRLPMEAEWEYAARAGTTTATYAGDLTEAFCRDVTLRQIAWFCNNADGDKQPVAGKLPNPWGLYDMLGNVWEWCWDSVFGDADHSLDSLTDPTGPPTTSNRIQRGGSFNSSAQSVRAASRRYIGLGQQNTEVGFRPARTTP